MLVYSSPLLCLECYDEVHNKNNRPKGSVTNYIFIFSSKVDAISFGEFRPLVVSPLGPLCGCN
jgi:hypothetical protein